MKPHFTFKSCLLLAALAWLPAQLAAQGTTTTITGPRAGDREITFGGNGASNKDFDSSLGGFNGSFGQFVTDTSEWLIRQSVNYNNPRGADESWNGSTRLAFDQHFAARGPFRPFLGLNAGRIYGEGVHDTWTAGLEGGAKIYVQPRTFIFALIEYGWNFEDGDDVDDNFRDGQFLWSLGVGFNF